MRCESTLARDDWHTRVETDSHMTATATEFLVSHTLDAYEHDERVYARTWTLRFPGTAFDGRFRDRRANQPPAARSTLAP